MRKAINFLSLLSILFISSCSLFVGIGGEDNEPPKIVISTPKDGSIYSPGVVLVSGFVSDNDKVKDVIIWLDNDDKISLGSTKEFQYTFSLSVPGNHKIHVKAIDNVGNESEASVNIIVDTGGPVISIASPVSNAFAKGEIVVSGSISDDSGIYSVEWSLDGVVWNVLVSNSSVKNYNFSFNINTTNYSDGAYNLYIKAKDISSVVSIVYRTFYINNYLSNVILYPVQNQAISGVETLQGLVLVNNPLFVSNIILVVNTNGSLYSVFSVPINQNYSYSFDSNPLSSGDEVVFTVIVNSHSGLSVTNSVSTYVDKTYPSVFVVFPTNGAFLRNASYEFYGTANDDTGIKEVTITFDNTTFWRVSVSNIGTNYFWYTNIHTVNLNEGNNEMYVTVKDLDNKVKSSRVLFTVDKTLPVIQINSPTNGSTVGTNFVIDAVARDNYVVNEFIVKVDGQVIVSNIVPSAESYIYKRFITNLSGEGERIIEFIAYDSSGNVANTTYVVYVNENPARTSNVVVSSVAGQQVYVRGTVNVSGISYDEGGVKDIYYRIDSSGEVKFVSNAEVTSTNWQFSFDSTSYSDGVHTLSIRAVDDLGGYTYYTTNIYIDNNLPFVSILNIQNFESYGGLISLQVFVTDTVSLLSFAIYTNGSLFTNESNISMNSKLYLLHEWDLTGQDNGVTNEVVSMVVDKVFFTNVVTNWFIVSNDIPELYVSNPLPGQYVSSNVVVEGRSVKSPYGIKNVELKMGNGDFVIATTNNISSDGYTNDFSHLLSTTSFSEGLQLITVKAIASNNSYAVKSIPVIVDYTPPTLSVVSPTNNVSYHGTVTISGKVSDNIGISNVYVYIKTNGVALPSWNPAIVSIQGTNWSTNWDTTTLPVGYVDIVVEAIDYAGNKTNVNMSIVVRPYISSLSADTLWIGGNLVVTGENFGTGNVRIIYKGATNTVTGGLTNLNDTLPSGARSGYVMIEVNGILSINSNWLDVWEMVNFSPPSSADGYARYKAYSNKIYFVQSARSGNSWASNVLASDVSGSYKFYPFISSPTPSGEVVGKGNAIDARGNLVAIVYAPPKMTGIWVTVFTNNGTDLVRVTNNRVDTITLVGADTVNPPLMDVKVDSNLAIHIVYSDQANGKIKYAKSTNYGLSWVVEDVVTNLSFHPTIKDAQPSIDVDSTFSPHILYFDYGIGKLKHAYKDGVNWVTEVVDSYLLNGLWSDIKIDQNNTIHCSYYNGDQGDLM
ncbi:MAG: Ig-like domain-containing protein, partial [Brevinematia bacterium]